MTESYNPTKTSLSPRETELLIIALQCLEGGEIKVHLFALATFPPPTLFPWASPRVTSPYSLTTLQINYDKFAKMAEYNNRKSACTILGGLIKHKITASTVDSFSVASGTGNATASPKKRAAPKA